MKTIDLEWLGELARKAGEVILEIYETDFVVEKKADETPLTMADRRSHQLILEGLRSKYPEIPVLSEEGKEVPYAVRQQWNRFWLVDPLDGTKEFVKRNGEFTVNIALIEGNTPVVGAVYLPVLNRLYLSEVNHGCWEITENGTRSLKLNESSPNNPLRIVASRSHPSPDLETLLALLPSYLTTSRGSALKFCALAAGEADFYPRFGPTWEWDTAAGQAILTAAGGAVLDLSGKPFTYNKPNLVNGPFLAVTSLKWLNESRILERLSAIKQKVTNTG